MNQTDGTTDRAQFLLNPATDAISSSFNNLGGANSVSARSNFPAISNLSRSYFGAYVQDDWRVSSRLTVNLGLRWEHYGVPAERDNRQANFIPGPSEQPGCWRAVSYSNVAGRQMCRSRRFSTCWPRTISALCRRVTVPWARPQEGEFCAASSECCVSVSTRGRYCMQAVGLFYGGYENYGRSVMPAANFPFSTSRRVTRRRMR